MALLFSVSVWAQPKCNEIADNSDKKDISVCVDQFTKMPPPPSAPSAKQLCECVANSILTDLTCADIKRYHSDQNFAAKTRKHIAHNCIHDLTSSQ